MTMIEIVNIKGTNRRNLFNCLKNSVKVAFVDEPSTVKASTLILPGVSHFGHYIDFLDAHGWREFLLNTDRKIIGICSGYHALCSGSEESTRHKGIGLLQGQARLIKADLSCANGKVPHVGIRHLPKCNSIEQGKGYFVHSYGVLADGIENESQVITIAKNQYAVSQINKNIIGLQYHPELSGEYGKHLLLELISR